VNFGGDRVATRLSGWKTARRQIQCQLWASAEIFPGGSTTTFCWSFSGCWRCNANGR